MRSWILLCLLLLIAAGSDAQAREWTSASGKYKFEAKLLAVGTEAVKLRLKEDGSVYDLPLKALSSADRKYLEDVGRREITGSPADVYHEYQWALARANSFSQIEYFFSKRQRDWWKEFDTDQRKELASQKKFLFEDAEVTDETIDGNTAMVKVKGKGRVSSGKIKGAYAKFKMVREGGAWRIDSKNISIGGRGVILVPIR